MQLCTIKMKVALAMVCFLLIRCLQHFAWVGSTQLLMISCMQTNNLDGVYICISSGAKGDADNRNAPLVHAYLHLSHHFCEAISG